MKLEKIKLPYKVKNSILGLGAQTKNRVGLAFGDFAYLGPVNTDLSSPRDLLAFRSQAKYFLRKKPKIVAYDLHPEYGSTKYALNLSPITYHLLPTQHHHAHIASCMVDSGLKNQKVIGVAFDGTGLGTDNKIWGAEFLICNYKDFSRRAHLAEIPLLGGQMAIFEPYRLALAWLYRVYQDKCLDLQISWLGKIKKKWPVLKKMYLAGVNAPLVSSMGRLFDAAAAIILAKDKASFEAELAIALEKAAGFSIGQTRGYNFGIVRNKATYVIDPSPVFKGIIEDAKASIPKENMAYKFHLAIAEMINRICIILRQETKINKVVLSGGVFQNKILLKLTLDLLYKQGFRVFTHRRFSCNDSGVTLGQMTIANFRGTVCV